MGYFEQFSFQNQPYSLVLVYKEDSLMLNSKFGESMRNLYSVYFKTALLVLWRFKSRLDIFNITINSFNIIYPTGFKSILNV